MCLLSSMPRDELDNNSYDAGELNQQESRTVGKPSQPESRKVPTFEGVQPFVLKGLMSAVSHESAIEVLSCITFPSCDSIFGSPETRLLMHVTGLLPRLGLQLTGDLGPPGSASPLQQQYEKACVVASNISL